MQHSSARRKKCHGQAEEIVVHVTGVDPDSDRWGGMPASHHTYLGILLPKFTTMMV